MMGRAIGSASHRRRSSVKPAGSLSMSRATDERNGPGTGIFETLRRYSLMPFEDQTPERARQASRPPEAAEEVPLLASPAGRERTQSSRDLLQDILDRAPVPPPRTSQWVATATPARKASRKRRDTDTAHDVVVQPCAEDWRPHVCLDEQSTPVDGSDGG